MADLNDFEGSLSEMSDEELTEFLREIRLSRRTQPAPAKKPPKSKAKAPNIDVAGMSPEMAKLILEQIGGDDE